MVALAISCPSLLKGQPFNLKFRFAIEEVDAPAMRPSSPRSRLKSKKNAFAATSHF